MCSFAFSCPPTDSICLIIHHIIIIILIILHFKGARVPSAPSTQKGGLPSGQEEKPIHIPYSKSLGPDDFGIQNFSQLFLSDKCKYCIIPSRRISHNKTMFLQQIFTLRNMMMAINNFSVGSGQFQSLGYENIFGFQSTRTLKVRTYISPTGGK